MNEYTDHAVVDLDEAGSIIANKNIKIDHLNQKLAEAKAENRELRTRLEAAEKLIEQLYGTLEEAMTYCEWPQWSPSMVDDCKSALAAYEQWDGK